MTVNPEDDPSKQRCFCGSDVCSGYLGEKKKAKSTAVSQAPVPALAHPSPIGGKRKRVMSQPTSPKPAVKQPLTPKRVSVVRSVASPPVAKDVQVEPAVQSAIATAPAAAPAPVVR